MKIVVNDIAAKKGTGGVFSVLEDFYKEAREFDSSIQWIFILSDNYFPETENIKIVVREDLKQSYIRRLWFEFFSGGKFINDFDPDLYLSLQNTATRHVEAPQIVYLHQPLNYALPIKKFSFMKRSERRLAVYQRIIGRVINLLFNLVKPYIIVQTSWLKSILHSKFEWAENRVIIYAPHLANIVKDDQISIDSNQFFYPATKFLYKNHQAIFEAVRILERRGLTNFKVMLTVNKADLPSEADDEHIVFLGTISRKSVLELYKSSVLLFPSYIETFGLPLVEAAMSGTRILAADIPTTREVLQGYSNVDYFDYSNSHQLADKMEALIGTRLSKRDFSTKSDGVQNDVELDNLVEVLMSLMREIQHE